MSLGGGRHIQALGDSVSAGICRVFRFYVRSLRSNAGLLSDALGLPTTTQIASDIAFDGCDSADKDLNLLKSNGGIHFYEKLHAGETMLM